MKVGEHIRIKDLKHIYSKWRGREAIVSAVWLNIGMLWIEIKLDGISLLFKENEVETLKGGETDDREK